MATGKDMTIEVVAHVNTEGLRELRHLKSLELAVRKLVNSYMVPEDAHGVDEYEEVKRRLLILDEMHGDGRTLNSLEDEIETLDCMLDLRIHPGDA